VKPNVRVVEYADQWEALRESDVFITHHGLNSTHEAVFNRVPMISYPFFGDQPALAAKCRRFGSAVPLNAFLAWPRKPKDVSAALAKI